MSQGLHDAVEAEIEVALADAAKEENEELELQDSEDRTSMFLNVLLADDSH